MKKFFIAAVMTAATITASFAGSGIFGTYVGINTNGAGNTWYGTQQPGPNSLTAFNGANLGTFDINTQTLTISGFQVLTFKNGLSDVFGANLNYRIYQTGNTPGSFTGQTAAFISNATFSDAANNSFSNGGDQLWGRAAGAISLNALSGISVSSATEFKLEIYFDANTSDGVAYSNNGGANYIATFTAVPEPSTYALLALGAVALGGYAIRRRRRVS